MHKLYIHDYVILVQKINFNFPSNYSHRLLKTKRPLAAKLIDFKKWFAINHKLNV